MKIKELYKLYSQQFLVDTDTRNIRQGSMFFALKGANFNGNKFAKEALEKGASYSIVDEDKYCTSSNIILVDDVLHTLQQLANYHRIQLGIPIVGLTGSNGKTTTKELINVVLSKRYNTTATKGNFNNHIGVPLTLLSMNSSTEIGIVEMGANHHGEIKLLSEIAEPTLGYITNFGKAHLEGFGSVQGVIEAKSELYDFIRNNDKTVIVNPNDSIQEERTEGMNRVFYSEAISLLDAEPFVRFKYLDDLVETNLIGIYNYNNIAAAITIGDYFNVDREDIRKAISEYTPTNNRSQIVKQGTNTIILDAYNANPTSMKAALDNFNQFSAEHKILILGDMFELGEDSEEEHQHLVDYAESMNFTEVLLVGNHFYEVKSRKAKQFENFALLKQYLNNQKIKDTSLLIKGSRGMQLERVLEYLD